MAAEELQNHLLVVTRLRRAADTFRSSVRVLHLLTRLLPDTDEGDDMQATSEALEKAFNAAVTTQGAGLDEATRALESEVVAFEKALDAFDRRIPMAYFREHFDASKASSVALADYASLLGRFVGDSPLRLDRIQFLLTRVISFFLDPAAATPERRRALLAEALPPVTLDEATRRTAVTFLQDAARRVGSFKHLHDLTTSGFFVDIGGYKVALRQKLLDPDVMAAAIELNEAINDNLHRLAQADVPSGKELEEHFTEVDRHIKSIFSQLRHDESAIQRDFEAWVESRKRRRRGPRTPSTRVTFGTVGKPQRPSRPIVLGVVTVLLAVVLWVRAGGEGGLQPMPGSELTKFSPLLVEAGVAPPEEPKVLIGQVDKAKWALLSLDDRRKVAEALARQLTTRGLVSATVMLESQVVIQVEGGQLLLVQ